MKAIQGLIHLTLLLILLLNGTEAEKALKCKGTLKLSASAERLGQVSEDEGKTKVSTAKDRRSIPSGYTLKFSKEAK